MPDPPQDVSQKTVSSRGGDHSGLGQWGERKAAEYLQGQGYRLLDTRFRCREKHNDLYFEIYRSLFAASGVVCFTRNNTECLFMAAAQALRLLSF